MYKLVISDTVEFPVKLTINDAGVIKEFPLRLEAKRRDMEQLKAELEDNGHMTIADYHQKVCRDSLTGWSQQRLVVDAEGQPAPFGPDALDCVLGLPGAASLIHGAYMEAITASTGAAGRAKN